MIIIRLAGGFGNQLFQFSAALLLAKTHKIKEIIIDDTALIDYKIKNNNMLIQFLDFSKTNIKISCKKNFITKFRVPKIIPILSFVSDKNFTTALKRKLPFYILDGYFQDCFTQENFDYISKQVKNMFIFNKPIKVSPLRCVIHIRGGDFVEFGFNVVAPSEYYYSAIKFMQDMHGITSFLIITDDEIFAKKIINQDDSQFKFLSSSVENDFRSIGSFPFKILSSSTFSFWASLMGDDEGAVIAPRSWTPFRKRLLFLPNEIFLNK